VIRRLVLAALALLVLGAAVFAAGYRNARADPVVRRAAVALPGWPAGASPITIALLSDIHMESLTMDAPRLSRIVAAVNAQHPDLVVIAGDFVEGQGREEAARAIPLLAGPLWRLRAPLGVAAVLGNHDHWTDPRPLAAMLRRIGVLLLMNDAHGAGPLALAGLDDEATHHLQLAPTLRALARLRGAGVMVAHSPEIAPRLPAGVRLLLAGHTHCGQVVLPIIGPPYQVTRAHYRCGVVRDPGRTTIVTAGLGTSNLPIRFGAPPDWWLVTVGPDACAISRPRS
jgi:predicted MPP superfamily phosphohydrolase